MAHPKRRQSHTRTAKRRTHDKPSSPHSPSALTVALGTYITLCAVNVVTTAESKLSRKLTSDPETWKSDPASYSANKSSGRLHRK